MAVISPAIGVQSGSHTAKAFRQLLSALAGQEAETFVNSVSATGPCHGLGYLGALAVTQDGTPNMSVDVAAGICLITGSSSLAQGAYAFTNDATENLTISTADATNPRRDLVIAQVRDNTEDASGFNDARLYVVTGTPAASPVDPVIPANCLVLARVAVAAAVTSITNANITALAGLASTSSTRAEAVNTTYTPTLLNVNVGTGGSPANTAKYTYVGGANVGDKGILSLTHALALGTTGIVTGAPTIALPAGFEFDVATSTAAFRLGFVTLISSTLGSIQWASATTWTYSAFNVSATYMSLTAITATVPATWAAGDVMRGAFTAAVVRV